MYKSPIELYVKEIQNDLNDQTEDYIYRVIQDIGVNVDKEELIKALQYDREQYEKGYKEALRDAATAISEGCGMVDCPCSEGCDVYSDEECIDRIINWFKSKR